MAFLVLLASIIFILVAIVVLRLHPFLALILASVFAGLASPVPLVASGEGGDGGSQAIHALELTASGFGSTAGGIGIVIVLAAIIGQCLMDSGAADKIVRRFLAFFGEKRAGVSLMSSGYFLSVPVFFDTVFFLLVPLARSLRLRTGKNYVLYVVAIISGSLVTHSLVPPTPGPLLMAERLGLELGLAIAGGFLLGIPPAACGLMLARVLDERLKVPFREAPGTTKAELEAVLDRDEAALPGFWPSVAPVLLPVLLITGHSIAAAVPGLAPLTPWTGFFGNKNFALLVAAFGAAELLRRRQKLALGELTSRLEPAIASAGMIILITSAGGAFGQMLARIGIDESLRQIPGGGNGISYLLLAWGIASVMKIAQGSGTVAIITTAGIMAAILPTDGSLPFHIIYVYAAIGFGSAFFSWMNDSGFWVVCKMSGFTEKETLATWSLTLAVIAITGLLEVLVLSALLPFAHS